MSPGPGNGGGWAATPQIHAQRIANTIRARETGTAHAARWPDGPGPITHGTSSHQTKRCRTENGRACPDCRAGDAARQAARRERLG